MIEATRAALAEDRELLDEAERNAIEAAISALVGKLAAAEDAAAVKQGIESLAKASDEFAARRMDKSIRAALAGRKVDELKV
jgi:molecular chaperone HscA